MKQRTKDLEDKLKEAEGTLAIISEKEFRAKASRLGLSGLDPTNEADIQKLRDFELSRSNTALLNQFQTGNNDLEFSNDTEQLSANSEYDLVVELEKRANNNDLSAKKILANMTSKVTEKSHEWEWDGTGKDLFKKAKGTPEEIEQIKKKKQQWRMIK